MISIFLVLEDDRDVVGRCLCLLAEQRDDGLRVIIGNIVLVEAVEQFYLRLGGDVDITQVAPLEEGFQHRFVALQELADQLFGINSRIVFCRQVIMTSLSGYLYVERHVQCCVVQQALLNGLAVYLLIIHQRSLPRENRTHLQVQVGYHVGEGIGVMFSTTRYLLLSGLQKVEYGRVVGKFQEYGQRLHHHADSTCQSLVLASFIGCAEQYLLFVVELCQKEAIYSRKKSVLEDAVFVAE